MSEITSNSEYQSQKFKNLQLKNITLQNVEFVGCTFTKSVLRECSFLFCGFHECLFHNCDLSLSNVRGSVFNQTRFEDSQLIGINWTESAWGKSRLSRPVEFVNSALNHSTFVNLNLKLVTLTGCSVREVDFSDADLTQANCSKSDFSNSRFNHTNLTEADFSGATNYTIAPNDNILKKTKFSLPEAMALLYGLDIILTEGE